MASTPSMPRPFGTSSSSERTNHLSPGRSSSRRRHSTASSSPRTASRPSTVIPRSWAWSSAATSSVDVLNPEVQSEREASVVVSSVFNLPIPAGVVREARSEKLTSVSRPHCRNPAGTAPALKLTQDRPRLREVEAVLVALCVAHSAASIARESLGSSRATSVRRRVPSLRVDRMRSLAIWRRLRPAIRSDRMWSTSSGERARGRPRFAGRAGAAAGRRCSAISRSSSSTGMSLVPQGI